MRTRTIRTGTKRLRPRGPTALIAALAVLAIAPGCSQGTPGSGGGGGGGGGGAPIVTAGSPCEPDSQAVTCGGSQRLACDEATSKWVLTESCLPTKVCVDQSHNIAGLGADETACCDSRATFDCRQLCLADPEAQKFLNSAADGALAALAAETGGCAAQGSACVCELFGEAGPGICTVPCAKPAGGDTGVHWSVADRKFADVQVMSAFAAAVGADGSVTRVCGAPLTNAAGKAESVPAANGLELVVNLVSTELKTAKCAADFDQSVKPGELVDLTAVASSGPNATVSADHVKVTIDCIEERGPAGACKSKVGAVSGAAAASVRYVEVAPRCDPAREDTRMNVALVLDHSGSISGFIDKTTFKEDTPAKRRAPNTLLPSDPNNARIGAVNFFIEALNDGRDRTIGYYYNEKKKVNVAASDDLSCVGAGQDGTKCVSNKDCKSGACFAGGSSEGDSFEIAPLGQAESAAFGAASRHRVYLQTALQDKVKYGGEGRTPLWEAVTIAYGFLKTKVGHNRHIVVVGDGPDTCTDSEDFVYKGSDGVGRAKCNVFENFRKLRAAMHEDGYPVQVHFVQFQAKGYRQPDAHMMEIACRSGGTYQFINSEEINKANTQAISTAMNRALIRVRYALSGTWRVGMKLPAMADGTIPTGKLQAVAGKLRLANNKFPSLAAVYQTQTSWKFDASVGDNEDRRVLLRKPCMGHSACGGKSDGIGDAECGANHCTEDGLCKGTAAPDNLPCGKMNASTFIGTKKCCSGKCADDC